MKVYEYIVNEDKKAYVLEISGREMRLLRRAALETSLDANIKEDTQEEFRQIAESLEYSNILYGPVRKR